MASTRARLGQRALAVLDVALRVPCIFIIDAIFSSNFDPGPGWAGAAGKVLVRVTGVAVSSVVLLLSQKALLRLYRLLLAVLVGVAAVLVNTYDAAHLDSYYEVALGVRPPAPKGPSLWVGVATVQLLLGVAYALLLELRWAWASLVVLDIMVPLWGVAMELPADTQQLVGVLSALGVALHLLVSVAARLRWLCWSCRYVLLLLRHLYRLYGPQLLLEDTWRRIRFPHVLRVFWLTRVTAQALVLVYVVRAARRESGNTTGTVAAGEGFNAQNLLSWDWFWEVSSNLIISGCDSTLTVLGMSAVISSVAHYLGLSILAFIGSTEEEDKRLGFVAPVLFFILALQTGLSSLDPDQRLVRLSRNMCLLLTAILHFIHGMTDPVLMSLSASHVSSVRRHVPVLLVSALLFLLPVALSHALWHRHALNTWLFAVTAFCVELCLKVCVSLTVYVLFMVDGCSVVLWEKLDDYVYYVRSTGSVLEFVFGVLMFGNGAYTMLFESGSKIRAVMMCLHAYFNIYLQAQSGWRTFINRRSAVKKINSLPEVRGEELRRIEDVCAICYQEFATAARVTPCQHYFHALCLRKWLYIQDTCPMCHQRVYVEDEARHRHASSHRHAQDAAAPGPDNHQQQEDGEPLANGAVGGAPAAGGAGDTDDDLLEDNDSIEYDEDEWGAHNGGTPLEEDYINDDTDATDD